MSFAQPSGFGTTIFIAGTLMIMVAAVVFVPVLDCPPTRDVWVVPLIQSDAADVARRLQALLKGELPPGPPPQTIPCEDCHGRGRISPLKKWTLHRNQSAR